MHEEKVIYTIGKTDMHGTLVYDPTIKGKRPAVLVAHAWMGQDDFARKKARDLAKLGYVAFAADLYGNGVVVDNAKQAEMLMLPLFMDRKMLRERIVAAYEALHSHERVDGERIGAIGFCFGGLTVVELLRSGVSLRGVVSFHGVLTDRRGDLVAMTIPPAKKILGALLMLHGHDDPMMTPEDIRRIQSEMTEAQVDWQMHIYGHAVHAFTNPAVSDVKGGMAFNAKANQRAWLSMRNFFEELFV